MAINQVTAANTFSHWLGATQQLINKYNAFETDFDNVANTANNVLVIKNDTQNIYSNTVNVYNAANNVYQDIIDYTSTAYDTANNAKDLANTAINNAQDAYDLSVAAYAEASNAYSTSEIAAATSENANTVATDILNNIGDYANTAANNVIYPIFDIDNVNSDNDTYYPILTESPEYLSKVVVSTARMSFIPATGTLTANTFNATTDIKFNGSVIANSSGWVGTTIPISKGGTGATSATDARSNLELVIGTNVQAYSAKLNTIAGLATTANNFIVGNGSTWESKTASESRTALGLAIGTNVQAYSSALNTIAELSATANNFIVGNGSTWESKTSSASRTALGLNLGTDAYKLVQTVSGGGLISVNRGTDGYYLKQTSNGFTWDAGPGSLTASSPLSITGGNISLNQNFAGSSSMGGAATSVANALTFSNSGSGNTDSYNGSVGKTISYNSVGAPKFDGTGASGTWGIGITGNAATAGSCTGNASTATTLATSRSINGTSFNGSANITTANWGTSRTITIGNTGKSVNGSGDVSWSLTEIGAATSDHSHNYLPTTGGTISGTLDVGGLFRITAQNGSEGGELWLAKPASGTSLAGSVVFDVLGDSIRIFENGGTYRGLGCNLTGCAAGQSALIHSDNVGSYAIPLSGGSITGNLSVSGTLSAGTFSPSSISTGNITATSLTCTNGNISTNRNMYIGSGAGPSFPLHVDKNIAWSGSWVGFDESGGLYGPSSGTIYISIRASSDIAGGRIFAVSDIRKKENINQIDSGLDFVKNVKPVTFTWKTTNQFDSGFIAQDLLKTKYNYLVNMIPDEVEEYVDDEIKIPAGTSCLVNYNSIVPILTKAIQEQQEIINNLQARIETLEKSANVSL